MVYSPWGGERVQYNLVTKQHMIIVNILLKISPSISCFFFDTVKMLGFFSCFSVQLFVLFSFVLSIQKHN